MSFDLKNTCAMYQRRMNKIFHHQIGRNMEVYVNNMVLKFQSIDTHIKDLIEIF